MLSQPLLRTTNAGRLIFCVQGSLNRASRRLQDHERIEGSDAVIATDVRGSERCGVARAAANG
jgi:hypothetical protein